MHERAPLETDVLVVVVVSRGILADAVLHDCLQNVERSALQVSDAASGLILLLYFPQRLRLLLLLIGAIDLPSLIEF